MRLVKTSPPHQRTSKRLIGCLNSDQSTAEFAFAMSQIFTKVLCSAVEFASTSAGAFAIIKKFNQVVIRVVLVLRAFGTSGETIH